MRSTATTVEAYLADLPQERREAMSAIRKAINNNIPDGFEETMSYGMIGWVVPHRLYPEGYHCDPKLPLPFINLASQKNYIALYHSGLYSDPELLEWFVSEYPNHAKNKLDMGKSCVRFKDINAIPTNLISNLAEKLSAEEWIALYEKNVKHRQRRKG